MGLIAIDARNVRQGQTTGLGRVALNLIRHIAALDDQHEYLLIQRTDLEAPIVSSPRFRAIYLPYDIASIRHYFRFGRVIARYRPTVYHSLHSFLPLDMPKNIKTVVTVPDFNWIQRPAIAGKTALRGWLSSLHGKPMHAYSIKIADQVVCISHQTKKDLFALYPHTTTPVSVAHLGVDAEALRIGPVRPEITRYTESRFILSIGSGRASKNPEGTIRAFAHLIGRPGYEDIRLLMVGRIDALPKLHMLVQKLGLEDDVDFTGMVSDAELAWLMTHALLLSFPSFWEGFGLPVIEAFALGCPVIASDISALTEVAGGAAWMIKNPHDVDEIFQGMQTIIDDKNIRDRHIQDGLRRAASFTWEASARSYLDLYHHLCE